MQWSCERCSMPWNLHRNSTRFMRISKCPKERWDGRSFSWHHRCLRTRLMYLIINLHPLQTVSCSTTWTQSWQRVSERGQPSLGTIWLSSSLLIASVSMGRHRSMDVVTVCQNLRTRCSSRCAADSYRSHHDAAGGVYADTQCNRLQCRCLVWTIHRSTGLRLYPISTVGQHRDHYG